MRHPIRLLSQTAAAAALAFCVAAPASDDPFDVDPAPTAEEMALDLFIVRPLSLAGTIIGTAVFIVGLPFEALALNLSDPARRLVVEPAKYTFLRDLGDLD